MFEPTVKLVFLRVLDLLNLRYWQWWTLVSESIALEGEIVIDTVSNVFLQQGLLQRVFSPTLPGYRGCHTACIVLRFDGWMNLWLAIKGLVLMGGMELIASTLQIRDSI